MLIATHHHCFVWRHTPSFGQLAVTVPLASPAAKDITSCWHVSCHHMMWHWGSFGALHKGNVNGGVRRGRGAAVKHGVIIEGDSILLKEALHPRGVRGKQELSESIGQSRARLNVAEVSRPGGQLMLAWRGRIGCLTLWDTAKTCAPKKRVVFRQPDCKSFHKSWGYDTWYLLPNIWMAICWVVGGFDIS